MIINLTQHPATPEQHQAGVVDLEGIELEDLKAALTFSEIPSLEDLRKRANWIRDIAIYNGLGGDMDDDPWPDAAMIGGAPYFMRPLEEALEGYGITPLYAFSQRESIETEKAGEVVKQTIFRHLGFVGKY